MNVEPMGAGGEKKTRWKRQKNKRTELIRGKQGKITPAILL